MASYYPHKQTVVITLICALAVIGTATYAGWTKPVQNTEPIVSVLTTDKTDNFVDAIESSDDWKNQFFTSENKTNTSVSTKTNNVKDMEPLTLTDQIGRNFFTSYIQLQQGNLLNNQKAVDDAANYTIESTLNSATQSKLYKIEDIKTSTDEGLSAIRTYGNSIATSFITYSPQTEVSDIVANALETNNFKLLVDIDPIIVSYQKIISNMLSIVVPQSLSEYHLAIINGLSANLYVTQGLRNTDKDPMQAMVALGTYGAARTILIEALQKTNEYFNNKNIVFSENEPGVTFLAISNL